MLLADHVTRRSILNCNWNFLDLLCWPASIHFLVIDSSQTRLHGSILVSCRFNHPQTEGLGTVMTGNHGASFDEPVVLPTNISYFTLMADQGAITPDILSHEYEGSGTEDDPYMVTWILNDPETHCISA